MDAQLKGFDQSQNRDQVIALLGKLSVDAVAAARGGDAAGRPDAAMGQGGTEPPGRRGGAVRSRRCSSPSARCCPAPTRMCARATRCRRRLRCCCPADGNFAAASTSIRQGFFAAYIDAGRNHAPRPVVQVYDSKGTADGAIKAYQQAVADGARLVVGPLTRAEVAAVFGQGQLPVPRARAESSRRQPATEQQHQRIRPAAGNRGRAGRRPHGRARHAPCLRADLRGRLRATCGGRLQGRVRRTRRASSTAWSWWPTSATRWRA